MFRMFDFCYFFFSVQEDASFNFFLTYFYFVQFSSGPGTVLNNFLPLNFIPLLISFLLIILFLN